MEKKKNPVKLTWQQWITCYVASMAGGGLTWYLSGNVWLGGGVLAVITAIYVFYLSGRAIRAQKLQEVDPATMTRQQRRAMERKKNK
ncbi:hypothetical protein V6B08_11945 [Ferrovibrio sp. MS7]|uniref:hypothetical protein n=1 Tax=Ferrovibrio plantarum TaxID=3119164 RepID=UPI003136FE48